MPSFLNCSLSALFHYFGMVYSLVCLYKKGCLKIRQPWKCIFLSMNKQVIRSGICSG